MTKSNRVESEIALAEPVLDSSNSQRSQAASESNVLWRPPVELYTSKIHGKHPEDKEKVRAFYQQQDELIESFVALLDDRESIAVEHLRHFHDIKRKAIVYARISFLANVVLLVAKAIASYLSGSLAVITSALDSVVDLFSGLLLWLCNQAIVHRDRYVYPQGRTRLEPVGIIVLCCIMSAASFEMIVESVRRIVGLAQVVPLATIANFSINGTGDLIRIRDADAYVHNRQMAKQLVFEMDTIIICSVTVGVKLVLYLMCKRLPNPSVQALAQDHRNDIASNSVALACGLIGYRLFSYADPIGAIVISIYIIVNWTRTGWLQAEMLTGRTASPDFLKKMTWIALNHHPKVTHIDTVSAFHFGTNFLVEIHIVLPQETNLLEAHNIGESLQQRLERLQEVERAFVHVDYESTHSPETEHKIN